MSGKHKNAWDDLGKGAKLIIPMVLLRHENFERLSPCGNKLIFDLARQFTGYNNGYLCCAWTLMKPCGWRSSATLWKAIRELEHYRLIVCTRQGGSHQASLYAFTWRRINEKPDKPLDMASTLSPSDVWKEKRPSFIWPTKKPKIKKAPHHVNRSTSPSELIMPTSIRDLNRRAVFNSPCELIRPVSDPASIHHVNTLKGYQGHESLADALIASFNRISDELLLECGRPKNARCEVWRHREAVA